MIHARRWLLMMLLVGAAVSFAGEARYEYDDGGRLRKVIAPDGTKRTYTLDPAGNRSQTEVQLSGGVLQFSVLTTSVSEATSQLTLSVTRTGTPNGVITVAYATANGTASSGSDYTATSGTLSWTNGEAASKSINVPILNDATFEGSEAFTVTLSNPTGNPLLGGNNPVTVTITDNDAASFSIANVSVNENAGTATFTVNKSAQSVFTHAVNYQTANGSATAPADYTAKSGTLSFAPAELSKTFTVTITNNTAYEGNEAFTVSLNTPTNGAVIGTGTSTATIVEDDLAPRFSITGGSQGEFGSIPFTITKTGATELTHAVTASTVDETAVNVQDYSGTTQTLQFAPTSSSQTITIAIAGDQIAEPQQTFRMVLSNATNGATISTVSAQGTIHPSGPTPVISISQEVLATEGVHSHARYTVTKTGASELAATVNYSAIGGSATAGVDYTAISGTLTFPPGGTSSLNIDVPIIDDSTVEGQETIVYMLSNPFAAVLDEAYTAHIWLSDTDIPPGPTITLDDVSVSGWGSIPIDGNVSFGYMLMHTGDISVTKNGTGVSVSGPARTSWLTPKTNMSQFQASASTNCPYASGFYEQWFPLSQPVAWGVFINEMDRNAICTITVRISPIANPTAILDTAVINVSIWSEF